MQTSDFWLRLAERFSEEMGRAARAGLERLHATHEGCDPQGRSVWTLGQERTDLAHVFRQLSRTAMIGLGDDQGEDCWVGWLDRIDRERICPPSGMTYSSQQAPDPASCDEPGEWINLEYVTVENVFDASRIFCERLAARASEPSRDAAAGRTAPAANHQQAEGVFRRRGRQWEVCFDGERIVLQHRAGMEIIHRLLAGPQREMSPEELDDRQFIAQDPNTLTTDSRPAQPTDTDVDSREPANTGDAGSVVMTRAQLKKVRAFRDEVADSLREATEAGNSQLAEAYAEELSKYDRHISAATFGGKLKALGSASGQVANTVQKKYRRALKNLAASGAVRLHEHLKASIRIDNARFTYLPTVPVNWRT